MSDASSWMQEVSVQLNSSIMRFLSEKIERSSTILQVQAASEPAGGRVNNGLEQLTASKVDSSAWQSDERTNTAQCRFVYNRKWSA